MTIQTGDIVLFDHKPGFNLGWDAIKFGEILEDGVQKKEYAHVAIAISDTEWFTADGTVKTLPIHGEVNGSHFDVYRPSAELMLLVPNAIEKILLFKGELYDWVEIVDDSIRYLTDGLIHLPTELVDKEEEDKKVCSTLTAVYLHYLGVPAKPNASPEDIYLAIKDTWTVV